MKRIVAADIGGTHARFAIAEISAGEPVSLDQPVKFQTSDYASFQTAWEEFGRRKGIELPPDLAIAFAGPVGAESLKLTNNPWVISPFERVASGRGLWNLYEAPKDSARLYSRIIASNGADLER